MSQQHYRVSLQPAFILHGRDFRDSSRLLDVFSLEYGRVTLVAKGARAPRSKLQGILEPFSPLIISWSGKGDVQTLTGAETVKNSIKLSGKQILSAYYINELLQRLMIQYDPHPELFRMYQQTLENFQDGNEEVVLRGFEKKLLSEIGYALNLEFEVEKGKSVSKDKKYYYDVENGPVSVDESDDTDAFIVSGQTLIDMSNEKFTQAENKREAKQLMRIILSHHLGGKPLKTRNLHWYKTL